MDFHTIYNHVLRATRHFGLDGVDNTRVCKRTEISELIALSSTYLAHNAPHDLESRSQDRAEYVSICFVPFRNESWGGHQRE